MLNCVFLLNFDTGELTRETDCEGSERRDNFRTNRETKVQRRSAGSQLGQQSSWDSLHEQEKRKPFQKVFTLAYVYYISAEHYEDFTKMPQYTTDRPEEKKMERMPEMCIVKQVVCIFHQAA